MAIKSIGKIVLYEQLDQAKITELLAGTDTIVFEIEQTSSVPNLVSAILPTQFTDVTIDYILALKRVVDASTWITQENAMIFKINYDEATKEFDLTNSYVRDDRDTSATMSSIPTNQLLQATFITPGLEAPVYTTIDLPYAGTISTTDRDKMTAIGLDLNLAITGSLFSIKTQLVPFKVIFSQPTSVTTEKYIIDFPLQNKIIEL